MRICRTDVVGSAGKAEIAKLLGVWISQDLIWSRNCEDICVKALSRLLMLTKLKYVGTSTEDLLDVYKICIRSCAEYCSVVNHNRLTIEQSEKRERIKKVCLKVLLGRCMLTTMLHLKCVDCKLCSAREKKDA